MQPDPVVRPPSAKSRRCTIAGRSPMPLTTRCAIDAAEQPLEVRRLREDRSRTTAYLIDGADAGVDQPGDGVEAARPCPRRSASSDFR